MSLLIEGKASVDMPPVDPAAVVVVVVEEAVIAVHTC